MTDSIRFNDRQDAGKKLSEIIKKMRIANPAILALPRGGVPVAAEIAIALDAPLDLVLVRKIGVPFQPEYAAAAVVNGGNPEIVINEEVARMAGLTRSQINELAIAQLKEIERRRALYLTGREHINLNEKTPVIVDDGIATGATIFAAIRALKRKNPERLIVAVPVASLETIERLEKEGVEVICLATPYPFRAVGLHYQDFHQLRDDEVISILNSVDAHNDKSN